MGKIIFESGTTRDTIEIIHRRKDGTIVKPKNTMKSRLHNSIHALMVFLKLWHNTMTSVGFAAEAGLVANLGSITAFGSIGIGIGATPSDVTDTQLESPLQIATASVSRVNKIYTNDTIQLVFVFSKAEDASLTGTAVNVSEVGVFNGNINGTSLMLLHQVYTPTNVMNWDEGDTLQVTVLVQMKQG